MIWVQTVKPVLSDIPLPTKLHLLMLPIQFYQLIEITYMSFWRPFSFKPPQRVGACQSFSDSWLAIDIPVLCTLSASKLLWDHFFGMALSCPKDSVCSPPPYYLALMFFPYSSLQCSLYLREVGINEYPVSQYSAIIYLKHLYCYSLHRKTSLTKAGSIICL